MFGLTGVGIGMSVYLRDHFTANAARINGQMLQMYGNAKALRQGLNDSFEGLAMMGGAVFGASLLASRGLIGMVKTGMEFSKIMDAVGAVSEANESQMEAMRDKALALGKTTVFSIKEIGLAMEELAKAGFDAKQVIESIGGVVHLAGAADFGLLQSADILNNVMQVFGKSASDADHVADLLTYAANKSNVNLDDLGESLKYLGDTATDLKIPLEDSLAILMKLGNAGLKGSIAGVSAANWLRNLTKAATPFATGNQKKGLEMLGLTSKNFVDGMGNIKPVTELVDILIKASETLTTIEKQAAFNAIFDVRGKRGVSPLMRPTQIGETLEGYSEMLKSADVKGMAGKVSEQKLDNLSGDVNKLTAAWQVLSATYTERIEPFLRGLIQGVTWLINGITRLTDSPIGGILAAAVTALTAFGLAWGGIRLVVGLFGRVFLTSTATFASMGQTLRMTLNGVLAQLFGINAGLRGISINRNGRPFVRAGQTVNHNGRTYRGGQMLPQTILGRNITPGSTRTGGILGRGLAGMFTGGLPAVLGRLAGFALSWQGALAIGLGSWLFSSKKSATSADNLSSSLDGLAGSTDQVKSAWTRIGEFLGFKYDQEKGYLTQRDKPWADKGIFNKDAYYSDLYSGEEAQNTNYISGGPGSTQGNRQKILNNYLYIDGKLAAQQQMNDNMENDMSTEIGY